MQEFEVRLAQASDEDSIFELCRQLCEEDSLFAMDEDAVRSVIKSCTAGVGGIIGVIPGEKELEGVICLSTDRYWYSKDWFMCQVFNFVPIKLRKSTRAKSLLTFAKNCSDDMKIPLIAGVVSNMKTEPKIKLFERNFPKAGAFFVYNESYAKVGTYG